MVHKLYIEDPYLRECSATITRVDENKIFLDNTIFYPEGGGQLGDQGWIEDYEVIDSTKSWRETLFSF